MGPVLVIGTGLIGTSIALALRRAGVDVFLSDIDQIQLETAVALGAGLELPVAQAPSLVVVAVPPRHAASVLAQASMRFPAATLTDVTSVKAKVLADAVLRCGSEPLDWWAPDGGPRGIGREWCSRRPPR